MQTTTESGTIAGISYGDIALLFGLFALAVAVGVWGASKISQ